MRKPEHTPPQAGGPFRAGTMRLRSSDMTDRWNERDLPVLKAVVEIFDRTGRSVISARNIESEVGLDKESVQRALRALNTEPYFEKMNEAFGGEVLSVGAPTSEALRTAGMWPTPENLLARLVEELERASQDESRPEEERGKLRQAAAGLGSFMSQVAINALGGAGGNIISG